MIKNAVPKFVSSWNGSADFIQWLNDVKLLVPSAKGGYKLYEPGLLERIETVKGIDGNFRTVVFVGRFSCRVWGLALRCIPGRWRD